MKSLNLPFWSTHGQYHLIPQGEKPTSRPRSADVPHQLKLPPRRFFTLAGVLAALSVFALLASHFSGHGSIYRATSLNKQVADNNDKPSHLRLLIPASKSDANICKTILSTSVLGYSTPVLINWGKEFHKEGDVFGGSHIAKITGVLDYLNKLPSSYDDDLVIFMDGYDVWYQLRPEVFIARYHNILSQLNSRLVKEMGGKAVEQEQIKNSILFSAQKRCWPKDANHPACYAVPDSTLPHDIYGPKTDTDIGDELNPFLKFRQRYLNSGLAVGPVAAMRKLFQRAYEISLIDSGFGSDQAIFAQILGEQEFQREVIRQRHRSTWQVMVETINVRLGRAYDFLDPKTAGDHKLMDHFSGTPYEFGIALDYKNELSLPTVWSEWDTEWIPYSDKSRRIEVSQSFNITPHREPFPKDIADSRLPFHHATQTPVTLSPDGLSGETHWEDVPLFTNLWTGVIPVAAHHNAMRYNLKDRLRAHWHKPWFQPHARALLSTQAVQPVQAVASVEIDGKQHEYWPTSVEKAAVLTDADTLVPWEKLCEGFDEEIFRDGEGPWMDPRTSP